MEVRYIPNAYLLDEPVSANQPIRTGDHNDSSGVYPHTFESIMSADPAWMEETHDYVQWLFPTETKSRFNRNAPVLEELDIVTFMMEENLQDKMMKGLTKMLDFFGLEWGITEAGALCIQRSINFNERCVSRHSSTGKG